MKGKSQQDLPSHLLLGQRGERFALEYLKHRRAYQIVARNVSIPLGRNLRGSPIRGEIDIIAYDDETLVFIEVKTRSSEDIATATAAVDRAKQRTVTRTARAYRRLMHLDQVPYRFDLVTIVFHGEVPTIRLHKGYFRERPLRAARSAESAMPIHD
jgi:putative endonuclease